MKSNKIVYKEKDPIKKIYIIKSGLVAQLKMVEKHNLSAEIRAKYTGVLNRINFPVQMPVKNLTDGTFLGFQSLIK